MGVCAGRTQGMQIQKSLVRFSSRTTVISIASRVLPQSSWDTSWKRAHLQEMLNALQSHMLVVKVEALREVGAGGLQMQVGQVVDGSLYLDGIILMNLGAHGWSIIRN